jgi:predicted ribosome quality control (RQC) complex YloA/Tae2 family protein
MNIMAFDGIFIYSLVSELKKSIVNGRVEKVNQPEKDEVILTVKNARNIYKLSLSASAVYPKFYLTGITKPNPVTPPMFCMVLRKYLLGSHIVDIRQLSTDRVVFIDFQSLDELGYDSVYTLAVEIMGKHSNITLIRQRDNTVMDSIKHLTFDMNSLRSLFPGIKYTMPPASNKMDPFEYSLEDMNNYINSKQVDFDSSFFSNIFTGVSKPLSKELCFRLEKEKVDLNFDNLFAVNVFLKNFFLKIKNEEFNFSLYGTSSSVKEFYCIGFSHLSDFVKTSFSTGSELVEKFYYEKDKADRLKNRSSNLQKFVNVNLDRCLKKINILNETLKECQGKDTYRIMGELLTANIYKIKKGDNDADVLNYYNDNNEIINIKLDKDKTPSQNIQHYFKKYNKLKKSEEAGNIQIQKTKDEYEYLLSVLTNILNAENYEEIEEIKKELIATGYIKFKKTSNRKEKQAKPMHFISSDNIDIYVGKNNIQNDYLTLKFAEKHDTWLHTKNIPGSHVIIKCFGTPPERTLLEAALLAAYYSKSKASTKVPVDYTEVKNVHKPNGAKPGMVIYSTNKTIYVDPEKPDLKTEK